MDDVAKQAAEALERMGFSTNESRAYVSLLLENPATGYEISQRTAIPRSAIYGVLRRLDAAGLAVQVSEKPARYAPLPPDHLFRDLRARFDDSLGNLKERLVRLEPPKSISHVWHVRGYSGLLEEAQRLIEGAENSLHVSIWRREASRLRAPLLAAAERGVRVIVFSFSDISDLEREGICVFQYGLEEGDLESFWRHKLIAIADGERVLFGDAEEHDGSTSIATSNRHVAELATTQVVMDLTLLAERKGIDVADTVAGMQGDRLGRLDEVLEDSEETLSDTPS